MASYRYRAKIPCEQLNLLGLNAAINDGHADTVVFSKPTAQDIPLLHECKRDGTRVIVDICDDHLNHADIGPVYQEFINLADTIVCPTDEMGRRIFDAYHKDFRVISDPYEMPYREPHVNGTDLFWFGHQTNLNDITPHIPMLDKEGFKLSLMSGPQKIKGVIPYSFEALSDSLGKADIVLLPSRKGVEYKSPNRLINAIRSGCFVVGKHPGYEEFRHFIWNSDIRAGVQWARHFQSDLNGLIKQAQDYIEVKYSPETIGKQWAEVLP